MDTLNVEENNMESICKVQYVKQSMECGIRQG